MSWYRQYRPKTLAMLHQASAREQLRSSVFRTDPPSAYLLVGPKGIGKTSSARILAKVLNCEENGDRWDANTPLEDACGKCPTCLAIDAGACASVIELDAASHRGIDDVRSLREQAHLAPADARIKVFILDEVHMLTSEAFNALLKILEEPPSHVRFILATTEFHKVPLTIRSRCSVVKYAAATLSELIEALEMIAKAENIKVEPEVFETLAKLSDGSFRDAVKQFEQLAFGKKQVSLVQLQSEITSISTKTVHGFVDGLIAKDFETVRAVIFEEQEKGSGLVQLQKETLQELYARLDELLTSDQAESSQPQVLTYLSLLSILNRPVEVTTPLPDLPFEIAVIKWCLGESLSAVGGSGSDSGSKKQSRVSSIESDSGSKSKKAVQKSAEIKQTIESVESSEPVEIEDAVESIESEGPIDPIESQLPQAQISSTSNFWKDLRKQLKTTHPSLEALLTHAVPLSFEKNILKIGVGYSLHKERLSQETQRQLVEACLQKSLDQSNLRVTYVVIEKAQLLRTQPDESAETADDADLLSAVSEVLLD